MVAKALGIIGHIFTGLNNSCSKSIFVINNFDLPSPSPPLPQLGLRYPLGTAGIHVKRCLKAMTHQRAICIYLVSFLLKYYVMTLFSKLASFSSENAGRYILTKLSSAPKK